MEWQKKQRYIKYYPKNLKYVSLFPSTKPLEAAAVEFQQKIMQDIEEDHAHRLMQRNQYRSENVKAERPGRKEKKDTFFAQEDEE